MFRRTIETNRLIRSNVRRPRRLSLKNTIGPFSSPLPTLPRLFFTSLPSRSIELAADQLGFWGWARDKRAEFERASSGVQRDFSSFPIGRQTHSRLNILKTTGAGRPFQRATYNRSSSNQRSLWRFCRIARIDGADLRPSRVPLSILDFNRWTTAIVTMNFSFWRQVTRKLIR